MITSPANPRLKLVRKLESKRQREKLGLFVAEGEDLVAAALDAGIAPVDVLVDATRPPDGFDGEPVSAHLLAAISTLAHPPRVIGVFRDADLPRLAEQPVGLALWHVVDPGNVGTLLRAADAFGAYVALSDGCADPTGPKALRAPAGVVFRVPTAGWDDARGRRIALVAHGAPPLAQVELGDGDVFLLGAEREGLPDDVEADLRASIPMAGAAESLNVAMAGTVALYEWSRAR